MEDTETARVCKYVESKTTRIMMTTVPHVTSGLGLRKFQADGFLLTRMYKRLFGPQGRSARAWKISPSTGIQSPNRQARSESLYWQSYPEKKAQPQRVCCELGWIQATCSKEHTIHSEPSCSSKRLLCPSPDTLNKLPWSTALHHQTSQVPKKSPTLYGTRRFITVFTRAVTL